MSKIKITHEQAIEMKNAYMRHGDVVCEMLAVLVVAERMGIVVALPPKSKKSKRAKGTR